MAAQLAMGQLLGFKNFFPDTFPDSKEEYAKLIGKESLLKLSTHFLSYFRFPLPSNEELLQDWFTFNEVKYKQVRFYKYVIAQYNYISDNRTINTLKILTVESFLKLFVWLNEQKNIADDIDKINVSVTLPLFQLYLLFNDDVLSNYEIARKSVEKYRGDREIQRKILAMGFPQNDFLNVDYAQLIITQFYKAIKLLDFISAISKYEKLYRTFLKEYYCGSKEEYLKSIGAAVILGMKSSKRGWTILNVPTGQNFERDCAFLQKISVQSDDTSLYEQNDYLRLRSNPLHLIKKGSYMVIYDLFLIKKIYTGLIFQLSMLVRLDKSLFKEDFLGTIRNEFSEAILLYDILKEIYNKRQVIQITGNEFKATGLEREPDFFIRDNKSIILFESKDFFIPGEIKLSYDFNKIEEALQNNRLEKAIQQLLKNIERTLLKQLVLDVNYEPTDIIIFPIIIVHDALYSAPALNYWVHYWLDDGLKELKQKPELKVFDFLKIVPLTIVEIDTLILYQEHFKKGELELQNLLIQYHEHVQFRRSNFNNYKDAESHALASAIPFAEFVRKEGHNKNIILDTKKFNELFQSYGIN